jgi:hypothetical protein
VNPSRAAPRPSLVLGVEVADASWLERLRTTAELPPGRLATDALQVPVAVAQKLLRDTVRLVADIPRDGSPDVVWTRGASELLVHAARTALSCLTGQITVRLAVSCDQLPKAARVEIPFAVGTAETPTGVVMATLDRPAGPAVVVDGWADPLIAFGWESVLLLATRLCEAVGTDAKGRALVPGLIGAARGVLLVHPRARSG